MQYQLRLNSSPQYYDKTYMTPYAGRAATIALVSLTLAVLLHSGCLFIVDFCARALLFEINGSRNRRRAHTDRRGCRRSTQGSSESPKVVACVIGHREDPGIFRACLSSYARRGSDGVLVICIDGATLEDKPMRDVYEEVRQARSSTENWLTAQHRCSARIQRE